MTRRGQLIERLRPHRRGLVETTRAQREEHGGARWLVFKWLDYDGAEHVYCKTLDEVETELKKLEEDK